MTTEGDRRPAVFRFSTARVRRAPYARRRASRARETVEMETWNYTVEKHAA